MNKRKTKRERASKNIRIYPSTLKDLHAYSFKLGWTLSRTVEEALRMAVAFGKWDADEAA